MTRYDLGLTQRVGQRRWLLASILVCGVTSLISGSSSTCVAIEPTTEAKPAEGVTTARLPRENLLLYRDSDSEVKPVRKVEDWLKRRSEIIAGAEAIMGRLPGSRTWCAGDAGPGRSGLRFLRAATDHLCL